MLVDAFVRKICVVGIPAVGMPDTQGAEQALCQFFQVVVFTCNIRDRPAGRYLNKRNHGARTPAHAPQVSRYFAKQHLDWQSLLLSFFRQGETRQASSRYSIHQANNAKATTPEQDIRHARSSRARTMEQRKEPRHACAVEAVLAITDSDTHRCIISEYSRNGLRLTFAPNEATRVLRQLSLRPGLHGTATVSFQQGRQPLHLPVILMHIGENYVGLSLRHPDPAIYHVLQHLAAAQAAQQDDQGPAQGALQGRQPMLAPRQKQHLMQAACSRIHQYLHQHYSGFCYQLDHALLAAADKELTNEAQQHYLIAQRAFRQQRQKIFTSLSRSLVTNALALSRGEIPDSPADPQQNAPLALVTKNDFEDWLLVRVIISRFELRLRNELIELQIRLDAAFGRPGGKRNTNPFSPAALCNGFFDQIRHLELGNPQLEVVYGVLQQTVLGGLEPLYRQLNQLFIDADILPGIDVTRYLADQARPAATQPPKSQAAQPVAADEPPKAQPDAATPARRGNTAATAYGTASQLMALHRQAQGQRAGAINSPEQQQATLEQLAELQQQLMTDGDRLQRSGGLRQLLQQAKGLGKLLSEQEQDAADTVESLFDNIMQGERIDGELADAFRKLQVPLLRSLLDNPDLFAEDSHPARQALNHIALLADRGSSNLAANTPLILEAISGILGDSSSNAGFTQGMARLDQLVTREKRLIERNLLRLRQSCDGKQRLRHANRQIHQELSRILSKPVPQAVPDLLEHGWRSLLLLSYLREGVASRSWAMTLQVIEQLAANRQPQYLNTLERVLDDAELLQLVEKGLAKIPTLHFSPQQQLKQVSSLLACDPAGVPLVSVEVPPLPADDQPPPANPTPALQRWIRRARALRNNQWFQYSQEGQPDSLLQLVWIADDYGLFVFANHQGTRSLDLGQKQIAMALRDGRLSLLSEAALPAVEQGLDALVQKVYDKLAFDSCHDPLTGFLNRKAFCRSLAQQIAAPAPDEESSHCSLMFIDILQFKVINNACGYDAGDQFLSELARRLTNFLPPGTLIGRLGADQFALLLDEEVENQGYASARQLKAVIEEARFHYEEHSFVINCALAVAGIARGSNQAMERLRSVEAAASLSKKKGYKDVLMVRPGDRQLEALDQVMVWVTRINRALDNDNLALRCQQITPIGGNRSLPHYEILLSVLDEQGEAMPPAEFIKVAEEYNRMAAVDRWVIEHVLLWMHENPEQLPLFGGFSVNLSGQSLNDDTFLDFIFDAMVRYPVPREKLVFEITETVAITNLEDAADFIREMRGIGCRFSLDDFGVGQSSYSYLKQLPVDFIKIDGNFVRDINNSDVDFALVKSITEMGHYLRKKVIAEYVGNQATLNTVTELGVDYAQGYLFGQPQMLDNLDLRPR